MKWEKVREIYPNQFVLIKVLNYYVNGDKKYITDLEVVKPIDDPKEAGKLLTHGGKDDLVYHTGNKKIVVILKETRPFRKYL